MDKKKPPLPTGRLSGPRGPALQNIPMKTELGRKIRDSFFKPSLGTPFSHFAEQEARSYDTVSGEKLLKRMLDSLPPGARVVSQVHDEIMIECGPDVSLEEVTEIVLGTNPDMRSVYACTIPIFKGADVEPDLNNDLWPPISKEDKEAMMAGMYGCSGPPVHNHITTECSGRCSTCGEQVHDSHEMRIKKLEQRVVDMERNLREMATTRRE